MKSGTPQKQKIDACEIQYPLHVKEREVWLISVGVNVDAEIDGKNELFERLVLIFRKAGREQFYGLPLTSKEKSGQLYRSIPLIYFADESKRIDR